MRGTHLRFSVGVALTVAALLFALPLPAQENHGGQPVMNKEGVSNLDLGTLQRTGPGGDLEHAVQSAGMHATISCTDFCSECHWLDTYGPVNTYDPGVPGSELINQFSTNNVLAVGKMYLITITGNMTYWANSYWTAPIGNPDTSPMFPSPGVPIGDQGYVGCDWEYLYGYPNNSHGNLLAGGPGHLVSNGISLDNGVTFQDLTPVNGQVYSATHAYRYLVWGQGTKAQFRVTDRGPHNDNYGQYWVCVQFVTPCGTVTPPD